MSKTYAEFRLGSGPSGRCAMGFWALLVAVSLVAGCKRSPTGNPGPMVERAAVPAPEGLVGEVFIPRPDRTWEAARATIRSGTALVPSSPAVFLGGALGLPLTALEQLDFNIPMLGAVVDEKGLLAALVAIHVKDGPRLVELMTTGTPRFVKEADGDVTLLAPPATDSTAFSLAVADNYLVIGRGRDVLRRCSTFVTRTLPKRPLPAEDIVSVSTHRALAGPVVERLTKLWQSWKADREAEDAAMRAKHGGSAPDFGDPAQALADIDAKVGRFLAILGSLDEARLALNVDSGAPGAGARYRAIVSMAASPAGPAAEEIASMTVASADPLLALPASVAVAFLTRDSAEVRDRASAAQIDAIANVLGGRLSPGEKTKIETAFRTWSKGRGDWLTGGLSLTASSQAAVVRGAVADRAALSQGAVAMLDLLSIKAIADPLANWIGAMKLTGLDAVRSADDGDIRTVHVVRRPPKVKLRQGRDKPADNEAFDLVWSVGSELFVGVAGRDAKQTHTSLQSRENQETLARLSALKSAVTRLGPSVSFALLIDAARFGAGDPSGSEDATVLLSYGKDPRANGRAWFELDAPAALVTSYGAHASALLGSSP